MRKLKPMHSKDFILMAITFVTILICLCLTCLMAGIINDQRETIIGLTKENEARCGIEREEENEK